MSSSGWSIWDMLGDTCGHEKVESRSRDIILRPTILSQISKIKIKGLRMCVTSLKSSHRSASMVSGAIFGGFDDQSGLREGQRWHERAGCGCVFGFQSRKIYHYCLRMKIRQFNIYSKPHTFHNLAKLLANVD